MELFSPAPLRVCKCQADRGGEIGGEDEEEGGDGRVRGRLRREGRNGEFSGLRLMVSRLPRHQYRTLTEIDR